jgi:U3 small nucleolar RNA-associated protein 24
LRGRIRKIPGVPCMYVSGYRYTVERMPEAFGAPNTTMWCIDRSKV